MNDQKLDFSALDPAKNQPAWDQWIDKIARQAVVVRRQRVSLDFQLKRWARPAIAFATAIACLVLVMPFLSRTTNESPQSKVIEEPVYILTSWAMSNEIPTPENILSVFGGYHEQP